MESTPKEEGTQENQTEYDPVDVLKNAFLEFKLDYKSPDFKIEDAVKVFK